MFSIGISSLLKLAGSLVISFHPVNSTEKAAGTGKPTHETTIRDWNAVMDVNLKGTFLCVKHSIPYIISSGGGSVINVSSNMGILGGLTPDLAAAKADPIPPGPPPTTTTSASRHISISRAGSVIVLIFGAEFMILASLTALMNNACH
jgi:hypothetical protein